MSRSAKLFLALLLGAAAHADDRFFGIAIPDPYRPLEVASSTGTQAWLADQDARAQAYFAERPERAQWRARLAVLTSTSPVNVPRLTAVPGAAPVDAKALKLPVTAHLISPSPDGRIAAYAIYPGHGDAGELHVGNDVLPWEQYGDLAWSADSRGFYYLAVSTALPAESRVAQATVRYHAVGRPVASDAEIFPATGNGSRYLIPQTSVDGRWLFVALADGFAGTTLYARDLTAPATSFQKIYANPAATATIAEDRDRFYLLTNDHAPNYAVWVSTTHGKTWRTLIGQSSDSVWDSLQVSSGALVLTRVREAASDLLLCSFDGTDCRTVALPAAGSVEDVESRADREDVFVRFESFFLRPRILRISVRTCVAIPWPPGAAKADVDRGFAVDMRRFTSRDGTVVPMWVLHAADMALDGSHPAIEAVYGGFGVSMTPRYVPAIAAWLANGGVYAVPLLRGGGEFGETWHRAGMGRLKQHTFDDAIAAADDLSRAGYTRADRIAIQGGSNGGLTAAAVITQRPDAFRAAVIKNPLTDMLRYPLFGEGQGWISEYGSPNVAGDFQALRAYSPYHRVRAGTDYPAVLIVSADADDRVDPLHARKFAAALQTANASGRPILFERLRDTGHAGADSATADIEEWADRLTFLERELGR